MAGASTTRRGAVGELLTAVKQLSPNQLREFRRGFAALMDDQSAGDGPQVVTEAQLLSVIRKNSALPAKEQRRFERLRRKR